VVDKHRQAAVESLRVVAGADVLRQQRQDALQVSLRDTQHPGFIL